MNRDIKFRAWNKRIKGFVLVDHVASFTHEEDGLLNVMDGIELMQYTGLKDKNGVEIYCGDIISVCFNKEDYPHESVVVEWDRDSYIIKYKRNGVKQIYSLYSVLHECEIIGNIYESKELLETT